MQVQKIEWSERYHLGIDLLDNDHKKLLSITNVLIEHTQAGNRSEIINDSLYRLLSFIETHFDNEEKLMLQLEYKGIDTHILEHRKFHKEIVLFCRKVMASREPIVDDLLELLKGWIDSHIAEEDIVLKDIYKEKRLQENIV